jgi:hypothetical protein
MYKHTHEQCQQSVKAIKDLIKSIDQLDEQTRKHTCDSVLQLCDQLLREPKK